VILFLDVFVLVTIFSGLTDSASQLATPEDYIPYDCQNFVIGADIKVDSEKLNLVAGRVNMYDTYNPDMKVVEQLQQQANTKLHPICVELQKNITTIKSSTSLKDFFTKRADLLTQKNSLQYKIDELKRNYDTALLEKIASMQSEAVKMQQERNNLIVDLNGLDTSIKSVEAQIVATTEYKAVWEYILGNSANNQKTLENDLAVARFWFPVKRLAMDFAFLLPLLLVMYFWNSRSIRKENGVQMLISSHLLVVVAIPTLWKIIDMVIEIIPKKFLETVMIWLAAMKLLAIWYYVLVIVAIFVALGIIYLIQKKFFSRERLLEKRLMKGECLECGKFLPKKSEFCPFCSASQMKDCPSCHKSTHIAGTFCKNCGVKI
jgi:hypothetical protein